MKYFFLPLFLFFTLACERVPADPVKTQTLVINSYMEPEYLDPALSADSASNMVVGQLFEGLTTLDPKTLQPMPGVAESWEVSEDGKVYTFHLRPNAKWSDGTKIVAEDFVYSWQRALSPTLSSRYAHQLFVLKNAMSFNAGEIKDASRLGLRAIDAATLEVELEHPVSYFLQLVAWYTYRPVKRSVVELYDRKWTQPEFMVGNGPFVLKEWTPQKRIVLEPNSFYWDAAHVKLKKIIFSQTEDQETALKRYLRGEVHFLNDPPWLKIPELRKRADFHEAPLLATYYLVLNTKVRPLDRKLLRQALSQAIDREKIVQVIHKGSVALSLTPPVIADYTPPLAPVFHAVKARELLHQAGFTDPKTFPKLTLLYNTSENHKMIAEMVQSMWHENLGVQVDLLNMEWKVLLKNLKAHDFSISRRAWVADYADPNTFLETFISQSGHNYSEWQNKRFDELVAKAQYSVNSFERMQNFAEAEKILLEEQPLIPLFHYTQTWLMNKHLKGLVPNILGMIFLKDVQFADR